MRFKKSIQFYSFQPGINFGGVSQPEEMKIMFVKKTTNFGTPNMFIMTLNVILNYVPLKQKIILFLGNIKILSLVFPSLTYSCFVYKYVAILTLRDF